MQLFDLHCDTLYKAACDDSSLYNDAYHVSINKSEFLEKWVQFFAIWIPDDVKGKQADHLFDKAVSIFNRDKSDKTEAYLTLENASLLAGDINKIDILVANNIKSVTLTWNDENEIGSGVLSCNDFGITSFGKEVVRQLERNNITVDVSHAGDNLFFDVASIAKQPFIATHSNSRTVCSNKRNLTDDQFKVIRDNNGLVGLNFYKAFLNNDEKKASVYDILRHADYFLNLGGENVIAIGSDFDGADMPEDIKDIRTMQFIYECFKKEFGTCITDKIFFYNAQRFFNI